MIRGERGAASHIVLKAIVADAVIRIAWDLPTTTWAVAGNA